jgi:hypothetical protein
MKFEAPAARTKSEVIERELNVYVQKMEAALEELAAEQAANPANARSIFRESLKIMRIVDSVVANPELDIRELQGTVDGIVRMIGLNPADFSLDKVQQLSERISA